MKRTRTAGFERSSVFVTIRRTGSKTKCPWIQDTVVPPSFCSGGIVSVRRRVQQRTQICTTLLVQGAREPDAAKTVVETTRPFPRNACSKAALFQQPFSRRSALLRLAREEWYRLCSLSNTSLNRNNPPRAKYHRKSALNSRPSALRYVCRMDTKVRDRWNPVATLFRFMSGTINRLANN